MDCLRMLVLMSLMLASTTAVLAKNTGTNTTSPGTHTTTKPLFTDYRRRSYTIGRSVDLSCTNKTWKEMFYTTWSIKINGVHCRIAAGIDKPPFDQCKDGKVMRNTTNGESYLHIPDFKSTDEGIYKCETAYEGASHSAEISVSAIVPPETSSRVIFSNGKREAVCYAWNGKPAASIFWIDPWNSSETSTNNSDGSVTVQSRMTVPDSIHAGNLSCIITHPSGNKTHFIKIIQEELKWFWIIIPLGSISFIAAMLAGFYITRKHLAKLSSRWKSKIPATPPPKVLQDVEEVEPYASYVQRVNSIYNSSAELCNA